MGQAKIAVSILAESVARLRPCRWISEWASCVPAEGVEVAIWLEWAGRALLTDAYALNQGICLWALHAWSPSSYT